MCWCGKSYGSEGSLNQHKKLKKHFRDPYEEGQITNQLEQEAKEEAEAAEAAGQGDEEIEDGAINDEEDAPENDLN